MKINPKQAATLGGVMRIHWWESRTSPPATQPRCIQPLAFQERKLYTQGETQ
ncbi:MAG: hypothetical protein WBL63_09980 [Candidatus Acidiferrum sp.]